MPKTKTNGQEDLKTTPEAKIGASKGSEPKVGDNVVTLPKDQFQDLLRQMEEMKKTNSMLMEIADKKALGNYYSRNAKQLPSTIRLRTIDGKVVVGWRSISHAVRKNPLNGVWTEDQRTELIFEDGTKKEMNIVEFEFDKIGLVVDVLRRGHFGDERRAGRGRRGSRS